MDVIPVTANRHPVDQLADVREAIRSLAEREAELKDEVSRLMGAADSLGGDQYIAFQTLQTRKGGLDQKAMAAAGVDLDRFRKPDTTALVMRVERRAAEVA